MAHSSVHSPVLVLYVNVARGDDTFPGTSAQPFRTLGYALQQAIAGTIIYVAPGRYSHEQGEPFPLVIPSDVILKGDVATSATSTDVPKTVLIEGGDVFFSPTAGYQSVTVVPSHRSIIQDVIITNNTDQGTGVWVESAKATLRHCQVNQCQREGMVVTTAGSVLVQDCRFEANHRCGLIFLADGTGTVVRTVVQRQDRPFTGYGIAIRDRATPTLSHNQVMGHQVGMAIAGTATPKIRGNHISHNQDGIVVLESAQPHLGSAQQPGENAIAANQRYDIQVQTSHPVTIGGNYLPDGKLQGNGVVTQPLATAPDAPPQITPLIAFPDCIDHWARAFIEALHQQGIIQGFPNGSFYPDESLTRAQYAALLAQLFDLPAVTAPPPFRDLQDSFWGAIAIRKASEMGFIAGFPDGTVRPEQELTRVQAMVSLVNGLGLTGGEAKELERYGDRATIPPYAQDEVATATYKHLVVNHPNTGQLTPNRPITRAETAVLLYQVQVIRGQVGAIASPYLIVPPAQPVTFSDVRDTGQLADLPSPHWAANFIEGLAARQLIRGIAPDQFAPEKAMSRAEFAALLVQLFNPLPRTAPRAFIDVPPRHWAAKAIQRVTQAGLLAGFADGSFQPQLDIKRWQLFTAVVSALSLPDRHPGPLDSYFFDLDSIPSEAMGAIATATQHQLVVNYPNLHRLNGNRGATRAEVAATLYQSLALTHRLPVLISPYIVPPLDGRNEERRTKREERAYPQTPPLPRSPDPPLLPPTAILSPVPPLHPITDME
ncbi:MAG: S-layer homology domain-containing protein, partial [Leptolyngbyaceae bacterium]|nr:S-layer homology domain-containing protein [Leptolyngbyaceae bacterium]